MCTSLYSGAKADLMCRYLNIDQKLNFIHLMYTCNDQKFSKLKQDWRRNTINIRSYKWILFMFCVFYYWWTTPILWSKFASRLKLLWIWSLESQDWKATNSAFQLIRPFVYFSLSKYYLHYLCRHIMCVPNKYKYIRNYTSYFLTLSLQISRPVPIALGVKCLTPAFLRPA